MNWGTGIFGLNFPDCRQSYGLIVGVLRALGTRATLGLVCDPGEPATSYLEAFRALSPHADIMIRPFDSTGMRNDADDGWRYTVMTYRARAKEYVDTLGQYCRLMECGNEITLPPEFVGPDIAEMTASAIGVCMQAGLGGAVCYFWDQDDPTAMGPKAFEWNLRSDIAGVSVYPNTYAGAFQGLDDPMDDLEVALPGIPKAILEFGTENGQGHDRAHFVEHQTMVKQFFRWRPKINMKYVVGGFDWDSDRYVLGHPTLLPTYRAILSGGVV